MARHLVPQKRPSSPGMSCTLYSQGIWSLWWEAQQRKAGVGSWGSTTTPATSPQL